MDVSIIIVNYNTVQLTKNCIQSIFEKTSNIDFEVILVDNASTDGSREAFEQDSRIKYVYSDTNLGFGRGNNLGYKYAKGDYIFLLNSDTLLINNAIYELVNFMTTYPEIAISGGALYNLNMRGCHSYGLLLPSLKHEINVLFRGLFSKKLILRINNEISTKGFAFVSYITGADMMLRRDKIEEIGLFDPDFFMYYEETEMSYRYAEKGYKSAFYPNAKIQHLEGQSFTFKRVRENMFLTSRKLYYRKTGHGRMYYMACNIVYLTYLLTSIIKDIVFMNKQGAYYSFQRILCLLRK